MNSSSRETLHCAIYTRKSTEHGLDLEFNSLDAQREACEAYIKSQASAGWKPIGTRYDDPAYSGGSLERPGLQQLLRDIEAGRVGIVVVYKIDRLTRSLADFAKLVEIFDAKSISFVAVTQQFNTTTSMGRLTLNVLLSFAQFERELSSERVRDKFAASRKKGKWMGGNVPLGYQVNDKKLVVDEAEALTVRDIFERYLQLKSLEKLVAALRAAKIQTKGRKPFTYGPLAYLLKNRIYIGEVVHKGVWFRGEHDPILDQKLFDAVQDLLRTNAVSRRKKRTHNRALLTGLLFDDRGNRMSPSFTTKKGVRYRFYVNSALLTGRSQDAGSVRRITAPDLEKHIISSLRRRFSHETAPASDANWIEKHVRKIVLLTDKIEIILKEQNSEFGKIIDIPALPKANGSTTKLIEQDGGQPTAEPDRRLVKAIALAHLWLQMLTSGEYRAIEELARAMKMHPRAIRTNLRLAFLAPDVTESILAGQNQPVRNLTEFLNTLPISWQEQRARIECP